MKKMKQKLIILGIVILAGLAIGWLVIHQRQQAAQARVAAEFDVAEVRRMDLSEKVDATGDVVTEKNAAIYSPYSATVKQILAKPGDSVRQGDVLLILQLKDADLINYSAGWKSSLEQAQENLTIAQKALKRQQILYKIQGTTIDDLESAQTKVQQYQAQVAEYRLKLASLTKNGVNNNNEIIIKAPFDAEVSWIDVKLEETVATTDELLTLGGASAIRVEAAVDQGDINQIRVGQQASISANDQDRTLIPGAVTSFGSTGTTSSNVVTFPVVIKPTTTGSAASPAQQDRLNPGGQNGKKPQNSSKLAERNLANLLKSGMTVDVTIMVDPHPNVLAIPARAVLEEDGQTTVKVLKQGKYLSQKVQLGYRGTDYMEVLSGLREGEQVAVAKLQSSGQTSQSKQTRQGGMMGGPGGPPPM
ncbi:multidrug efflux pump subunit AcrA (membrane-fusion protein) [Hydrogenispora ethanolica]|jgi:macrolide-specific efflux system membrane fusion protein|uniref:Multidrug efflux pump subunit AcrA (Membrane-fusion protein) n=1 Tax=Hydrogenispora ethanolica TaxID=1082276 RepID=A0A4R1RQQ9_HYDET|nr:HlyD family efflux transporter periplasmic adaptor subunit [Hydrogenispora ethanolica]TCL68579.1 multidrug efflux pump subunit AcrA (membrane-fusion protein) [Hydrogenispora ethanolica]